MGTTPPGNGGGAPYSGGGGLNELEDYHRLDMDYYNLLALFHALTEAHRELAAENHGLPDERLGLTAEHNELVTEHHGEVADLHGLVVEHLVQLLERHEQVGYCYMVWVELHDQADCHVQIKTQGCMQPVEFGIVNTARHQDRLLRWKHSANILVTAEDSTVPPSSRTMHRYQSSLPPERLWLSFALFFARC